MQTAEQLTAEKLLRDVQALPITAQQQQYPFYQKWSQPDDKNYRIKRLRNLAKASAA